MKPRLLVLLLLVSLVVAAGCRRDADPIEADTDDPASIEVEPPPPPQVRQILDRIQPSIPLWPGASSTENPVRTAGDSTIIDLSTDDSFPMVWYYYVTYLAQYRGWTPPAPFPPRRDSARSLDLDLNEIMQDPFIPGTEISSDSAESVTIQIREDLVNRRVNIRYLIEPRPPAPPEPPEESS
jgi:hypothetical protein